MTTTFQLVQGILAKKHSLPLEFITPESTLESLKLDSLDLIEILFDAEDEFHIRFPKDLGMDTNISTVKDIVDLIDRLTAQQASSPGAPNKSASRTGGEKP
jgi:acyl carrier protein